MNCNLQKKICDEALSSKLNNFIFLNFYEKIAIFFPAALHNCCKTKILLQNPYPNAAALLQHSFKFPLKGPRCDHLLQACCNFVPKICLCCCSDAAALQIWRAAAAALLQRCILSAAMDPVKLVWRRFGSIYPIIKNFRLF